MVLAYLKNLVFPPQTRSHRRNSNAARLGRCDLDNRKSPSSSLSHSTDRSTPERVHSFSDEEKEYGLQSPSASSSISGDTVIETPPRTFKIDPRMISDATIGLSDGLTVPFALTAGLSALGDTRVVIFGGLAELTAGAISMGMGGYLAARSESEAYETTLASTRRLVKNSPYTAAAHIRNALAPYFPARSSYTIQQGENDTPMETIIEHLSSNPTQLVDFLMRFHHGITPPEDTRSARVSAFTIALSYFLGGFVPLLPYFFAKEIGTAFWWSVGMMVVALFAFGAGKTWLTSGAACEDGFDTRFEHEGAIETRLRLGARCGAGGVQMVVLGGVAAAAAIGLVKVFDQSSGGV